MAETIAIGAEILLGMMVIPWCAWVTTSIFGLRTQTALLKEQCASTLRIEKAVVDALGKGQNGKPSNPVG